MRHAALKGLQPNRKPDRKLRKQNVVKIVSVVLFVYFCGVNQEDQKLEQIINGAREMFLKYGIRSVNMDDVARHLGISKKTLYNFVKDKNELVDLAVKHQIDNENRSLAALCCNKLNAIDEQYEVSKIIADQFKQVQPSVMFDLQKYHPSVMKHFEVYKEQVVSKWLYDNMERGVREGYYREDLNIPIIARLYLARMSDFFKEELFPSSHFDLREVYLELFRYHIRGIASAKGLEYLIEKVKKEKQNLSNNS